MADMAGLMQHRRAVRFPLVSGRRGLPRCRHGRRAPVPPVREPRPALRRPRLPRRHVDRHLLPAELPGDGAEARATCASTARPPPRSAPGFRACKRCRPDASPGSPEWNVRADAVGRAMRLIAGRRARPRGRRRPRRPARLLASATSTRLVTDELGAGPLALARAQRAQTARMLIETTAMPFTDVAFAAGFASIRQFNDTVREVFAPTPTELRARGARRPPRAAARSGCGCRTARRSTWAELLAFLGRARRSPASRTVDGDDVPARARPARTARRRRRCARATATCACTLHARRPPRPRRRRSRGAAACSTSTPTRSRSTSELGADPVLGAARRGAARPARARRRRRRTSSRCARCSASRSRWPARARSPAASSARYGAPLRAARRRAHARVPDAPRRWPTRPTPTLAMPARAPRHVPHRDAAASPTASSTSTPAPTAPQPARACSRSPGIGPWTAEYVAMRALGDPDALPATDLGVRTRSRALGCPIGRRPRRALAPVALVRDPPPLEHPVTHHAP